MNIGGRRFAVVLSIGVVLAGAALAVAQEPQYIPKTDEVTLAPPPDLGFNPWVTIGANVSFGHNRSVVGKIDGQNWTLGGSLDTGFDYQVGQHDWRNRLQVLETFTYGPPINEFVKSADQVTLGSDYYYKIPSVPWLGPFARFLLDTSLFPGEDVQATYDTRWSKDGQVVRTGKRIQLTDPFLPLTLKESVGVFARPLSRPWTRTASRNARSRTCTRTSRLVARSRRAFRGRSCRTA